MLPDDAMRRSRLPYFFRALYTHMGEHGRIVTVRDEADTPLGVAAWLTTGGYPLRSGCNSPAAVLAARVLPTTARAARREPLHGGAGGRAPKGPPLVPDGALRRPVGATLGRRHDADGARARAGRRRGCRRHLETPGGQRRVLPTFRVRPQRDARRRCRPPAVLHDVASASLHQPIEPSICSSIRRDHSTAYSMGSVRVTGSMKPLTIMPMAWLSVSPRLIR